MGQDLGAHALADLQLLQGEEGGLAPLQIRAGRRSQDRELAAKRMPSAISVQAVKAARLRIGRRGHVGMTPASRLLRVRQQLPQPQGQSDILQQGIAVEIEPGALAPLQNTASRRGR